MLLSYAIVDIFSIIYMQIWALVTESQRTVSDTQVTVKACSFALQNI